jgi:[acyl-carrier-protein] S-malonyltransferase
VTLGYLFGAAISDPDPNHGAKLYAAFPTMRETFAQVEDWTGVPAKRILRGEFDTSGDVQRFALNGVRLAALALGICDVLAESDVLPGVVGGISLGGLVSCCVAGAVGRRELFGLLMAEGGAVPQDLPPQGGAIAVIPATEDSSWYYGAARPDVYLAGDFGLLKDGSARLLMLSGTRAALGELIGDCPPGRVSLIEGQPFAVHSPLRQYAADYMAETVARLRIADPSLPVCSFLEQRTLLTSEDVRDLFRRNKTSTMRLPAVCQEMKGHGARLALVLGPTLPAGVLSFPFPVVRVTEPQEVTEALTAIYEYGVDLAPVHGA